VPARHPVTVEMHTSVLALNALNFFMADVHGGLGAFLGVFLQQRHWSPGEIGLVMTIDGLAGMAATTPLGALVDRTVAKRAVVVIAALAVVAASFVIFLVPSFPVTAASQIVSAIAAAAIGPRLPRSRSVSCGKKAFRINWGGMKPSTMRAMSPPRCSPECSAISSASALPSPC
jgi:predicted MFS family arabinose efflux permease